uniref:Gremlin 2, DAN family BMP antagonist n=1 Tax=Myotis lucifugus TaxID=59463 RepID=G1QAZ6_MYOLU
MFWKLWLSVILAAALARAADGRRNRPAGAIPSPYKDGGGGGGGGGGGSSNNHSERWQHQVKEVLASSQEALVVTERKYLSDWCKTQPLRQTLGEEGCRSRTVLNRFCYGQCNFLSTSRGHGAQEEASFQSCASASRSASASVLVGARLPRPDPPFRLKKSVNLSDSNKQ